MPAPMISPASTRTHRSHRATSHATPSKICRRSHPNTTIRLLDSENADHPTQPRSARYVPTTNRSVPPPSPVRTPPSFARPPPTSNPPHCCVCQRRRAFSHTSPPHDVPTYPSSNSAKFISSLPVPSPNFRVDVEAEMDSMRQLMGGGGRNMNGRSVEQIWPHLLRNTKAYVPSREW